MKKMFQNFWLMAIIFTINSCALLGGAAVLQASREIDQSTLSSENENFQKESGINLTVVKRGLWSMQNTYRNSSIEIYYKSLLVNDLVFSLNNDQRELVRQNINGNDINIAINRQFQNYSEYEKEILLIVSTSSLALLRDNTFNRNDIPQMFFRFINEYDTREIPGIINAQWYKDRNITITNDGIIIG